MLRHQISILITGSTLVTNAVGARVGRRCTRMGQGHMALSFLCGCAIATFRYYSSSVSRRFALVACSFLLLREDHAVRSDRPTTTSQLLDTSDLLRTKLLPRTASVLRGGRLHPIPEGSFLGFPVTARALAVSSLFSMRGKVRMAYELVVPRRLAEEDESVASFVGRRFGREAVDYLAEPLLAGIHAGNVDRLSVRALFPRLGLFMLITARKRSGEAPSGSR